LSFRVQRGRLSARTPFSERVCLIFPIKAMSGLYDSGPFLSIEKRGRDSVKKL